MLCSCQIEEWRARAEEFQGECESLRRAIGEVQHLEAAIAQVNYLYDPDRIEENLEAHAEDGRIDATASLRRLLDR